MENQKSPLSMYSAEVQKIETTLNTYIYFNSFISIYGLVTEILTESINDDLAVNFAVNLVARILAGEFSEIFLRFYFLNFKRHLPTLLLDSSSNSSSSSESEDSESSIKCLSQTIFGVCVVGS